MQFKRAVRGDLCPSVQCLYVCVVTYVSLCAYVCGDFRFFSKVLPPVAR